MTVRNSSKPGQRDAVDAVFADLRGLFDARLRQIDDASPDTEALIVEAAQRAPSVQLPAASEALVRSIVVRVRRDELKRLTTDVAVLGFERHGQMLVLPNTDDQEAKR